MCKPGVGVRLGHIKDFDEIKIDRLGVRGFVQKKQHHSIATGQEVDLELKRWKDWLSSRSRKGVTGILIYVYDNLSGVSPKHVLEKKGAGLLDLSTMKLELHKTAMQKRMANTLGLPPTPLDIDFQDGLEKLHDYHLQISGYFQIETDKSRRETHICQPFADNE